jgi:diacylglycerol kinase (ATP)
MIWKKRFDSFRYAFAGLKLLFKTQPNARIHIVISIFMTILGFGFQISKLEWVAIIGCFAFVLCLEAINTAIENLVDLASPAFHPLARNAKDVAAAAVLIAAIATVLIGTLIFLPKIFPSFF